MISATLTVLASLFALAVILRVAAVLAYARSPQCAMNRRLKRYGRRSLPPLQR